MGISDTPLSEQPAAGDAGNSFLSGVLASVGEGALTDTKKAEVFNQKAHHLKDLAANGQFAINEAGMQDYVKLCDDFLAGYEYRVHQLRQLTQRQPLGSSPYALEVADYDVKVANGDEKSLMHNLELLADGFRARKEAFQLARRNYDETENTHTMRFGKLGAEQG